MLMTFLVVFLKTQAKTAKLTTATDVPFFLCVYLSVFFLCRCKAAIFAINSFSKIVTIERV